MIGVKTGESATVTNHWIGKTTVEVEVPMEAATLRELLHKLNAKVWLWFVPRRDVRARLRGLKNGAEGGGLLERLGESCA